jgi:hypothetical protein
MSGSISLLPSLSAFEKKREENCRSAAVKKRSCLTTNGRSLNAFSETQAIFSFLSAAAAFFVYFLGLKPKSKSLSGLRTIRYFYQTTKTLNTL